MNVVCPAKLTDDDLIGSYSLIDCESKENFRDRVKHVKDTPRRRACHKIWRKNVWIEKTLSKSVAKLNAADKRRRIRERHAIDNPSDDSTSRHDYRDTRSLPQIHSYTSWSTLCKNRLRSSEVIFHQWFPNKVTEDWFDDWLKTTQGPASFKRLENISGKHNRGELIRDDNWRSLGERLWTHLLELEDNIIRFNLLTGPFNQRRL